MSDTLTADMCEIHHIHPDKLKTCAMRKLDDETSLELADLFKVLGDKTRIKLLSLLAAEDELCVCDIAESLQMGQSAISHQLRLLKQARLVSGRREGKQIIYYLADDHVRTIIEKGMEHILE